MDFTAGLSMIQWSSTQALNPLATGPSLPPGDPHGGVPPGSQPSCREPFVDAKKKPWWSGLQNLQNTWILWDLETRYLMIPGSANGNPRVDEGDWNLFLFRILWRGLGGLGWFLEHFEIEKHKFEHDAWDTVCWDNNPGHICMVFLTISMLPCLDIACQQGCEGLGNMFLPHATAARHVLQGHSPIVTT